jgi:hypothetical protein
MKVIVIKFGGALGNQLFQYALYLKIRSLGRNVKADIKNYRNGNDKRLYYLSNLGVDLPIVEDDNLNVCSSGNRAVRFIKNRIVRFLTYEEKHNYCFDERVLNIKRGIIRGYWQCPKYFDDIKPLITKSIVFPELDSEQEYYRKKMMHEDSVFVHVRMGDYLTFSDKYGGICTKEYYDKAFQYLEDRIDNPIYYGFSDDVNAAKSFLQRDDIIWLDMNTEETAYNDLYLMASCKHCIIANSSFSWWGVYLGKQENKIVIAPDKWTNTNQLCDIWCDGWIKIKG